MDILSFLSRSPKFLFVMGKSGSGKSTLAETLENIRPGKYKRVIQYTTRDQRETEKDGVDYNFITKTDYKAKEENGEMMAQVKKEFPPSYYGTPIAELDEKRTNVIVVSAEGLLNSLNEIKNYGSVSILNITDVDAEVERTDRVDAGIEEKYNTIILDFLKNHPSFKKLNIVSISHSELIAIRNDKAKLLKFLKGHKL